MIKYLCFNTVMSWESLPAERAHIFTGATLPTPEEIDAVYEGGESDLFIDRFHPDVGQYEVLNSEFVNGMAEYLMDRAQLLRSEGLPALALEIGAGTGRLSYHLRQAVDPAVATIIAIDSGEWQVDAPYPVEQMDHITGLRRYQPNIVVASWMPNNTDWTQDIRDTGSVMEYILIGEGRYGCCGDDWLTWGSSFNQLFKLEEELDQANDKKREELEAKIRELETAEVPSERDGFVEHHLTTLTSLQTKIRNLHSITVSFRRESTSGERAAC